MTEPKKTDHWNSLLNEIGIASPSEPLSTPAEAPAPPPSATAPSPAPPRSRPKPESKPTQPPPKRSSWSSVLGALGLAVPEPPSPIPAEPGAVELPVAPPPRELPEPAANPLDEIKPRYKREEPPFPPSRRREVIDDVALDINLDADFATEPESPASAETVRDDLDVPPAAPRRDADEDEQRRGRRRRRRRGGRRGDGPPEGSESESQVEGQAEPFTESEFARDFDIEPETYDADEPPRREEETTAASESRDEGQRRRRRRRGRGSREGGEARPASDVSPPRRRERRDEARSRVPEPDEAFDENDDDLSLDDELDLDQGEHAVHKKIPTWADTVGMLIDANIAARSSRQADRGRPRRGRRDR